MNPDSKYQFVLSMFYYRVKWYDVHTKRTY